MRSTAPRSKDLSDLHAGDIYDATAVDKTVEAISRELARRGFAFAEVRPHGERDMVKHEIALAFTIEDAPRVYVERIDILGNTRTRDYVIRREFDIGEGDPYNHTMIEASERRLNNLGYFKTVHISSRPGSTADRVIVTVQVEDKPTGSISVGGGYSTTAGALAEIAYTETNFLGRGQYLRASVSVGQYGSGEKLSFTEPYFMDQRLAAGFDIFHQAQYVNPYAEYATWTTGVNLRLGIPITDEFTFQPNYSIYQSAITIPNTTRSPTGTAPSPTATPRLILSGAVEQSGSRLADGEHGGELLDQRRGLRWRSRKSRRKAQSLHRSSATA